MRYLLLGFLFCLVSWPAAAQNANKDPIARAVQAGRKYLFNNTLNQQAQLVKNNQAGIRTGELALYALALLESGMSSTDPTMSAIINRIRGDSLAQIQTYDVALSLMLLDKWGRTSDGPLLQYLGIRLLAGQHPNGGWGYTCGSALTPELEKRLRTILIKEVNLKTPAKKDAGPTERTDLPDENGKLPPLPMPTEPKLEEPKENIKSGVKPLHPEIAKLLPLMTKPDGGLNGLIQQFGTDNSNTQFATIGLIVARKNGVPVEDAVQRLDQYYRNAQTNDGGWGYRVNEGGIATPSMTCAGVLGIAAKYGAKENQEDPKKDIVLEKGLSYLGRTLESNDRQMNPVVSQNLYFVWGLERVGVGLSLEQISGVDWYRWAANNLVRSQNADGSWSSTGEGGYGNSVSTAFALLVLKKANFASELTTKFKGKLGDIVLKGRDINKTNVPTTTTTVMAPPANNSVAPPPITTPKQTTELNYSPEAKFLQAEFLKAAPAQRLQMIEEYRDKKGVVYSEALALLAATQTGIEQKNARDALSQRFTRMTANTLRRSLTDPDREFRRAACFAIALKPEKTLFPELILRLEDSEELVYQAATAALSAISGQKVPSTNDDLPARKELIKQYQAWLAQQPKE